MIHTIFLSDSKIAKRLPKYMDIEQIVQSSP
jgi:hypothetical protein